LLLANLSRQKRINLALITFSVLLLFFHNCGNVNISQRPDDLGSQGTGGNGGTGPGNGNNPPVGIQTKVTDLYFCESYVVSGHLRYYVHPFNISNHNFGQKFETGNCVGHMTFDTNNDGRDEFVHNYTNSTVHDCKLEVYNTSNSQILFSKPLPGLLTYTDNPIRICSGISWPVKDQNNDGKADLYYLYRTTNGNNTQNEKLMILDGLSGQEITSANAPSSNTALIGSQINDVNNDGLEDFLGFVPGSGTQTEIRDVKIAIYDAKAVWGMPIRTYTLPVNQNVFQTKILKNKNGAAKYLVSSLRSSVNAQGVLSPVEVIIGLYDANLNRTHSFTKENLITPSTNNSTLVDSTGDYTGDGLDDVIAVRYDSTQGKYTSYLLNGQDLSLIQEFSGAWISQKLGRPVSDFYRTIGFAQADNDEALELFLLVWEPSKISVIAIKNNGQVVVDKASPSEWISEVFQIRTPL
jgi:hypothetical protein